jgi:hypothetical protein
MQAQSLSQAGCFASARALRAHAQLLRELASAPYLDDDCRKALTREADDRQADRWLDAASEE